MVNHTLSGAIAVGAPNSEQRHRTENGPCICYGDRITTREDNFDYTITCGDCGQSGTSFSYPKACNKQRIAAARFLVNAKAEK